MNDKDYERMQALYPKIGATVAIRALIHAHVSKVQAKASALVDDSVLESLDIDLDD